jgi:hypothetical protein
MSFLRRLLGGGSGNGPDNRREGGPPEPADERGEAPPLDAATLAAPDADADAERARERELAHQESERLDELQRRQLRFAAYAWKPADQGGARRADDADPGESAPD